MSLQRMNVDLSQVDWAAVGDRVCVIIAAYREHQKRFEKAAAARKTNTEALMAAAITEMIREHLEGQVSPNE